MAPADEVPATGCAGSTPPLCVRICFCPGGGAVVYEESARRRAGRLEYQLRHPWDDIGGRAGRGLARGHELTIAVIVVVGGVKVLGRVGHVVLKVSELVLGDYGNGHAAWRRNSWRRRLRSGGRYPNHRRFRGTLRWQHDWCWFCQHDVLRHTAGGRPARTRE